MRKLWIVVLFSLSAAACTQAEQAPAPAAVVEPAPVVQEAPAPVSAAEPATAAAEAVTTAQ